MADKPKSPIIAPYIYDFYLRVNEGSHEMFNPIMVTLLVADLSAMDSTSLNVRRVVQRLKADKYIRGRRLITRWVSSTHTPEGRMLKPGRNEWVFREKDTIILESAIAYVEQHEGTAWLNEEKPK